MSEYKAAMAAMKEEYPYFITEVIDKKTAEAAIKKGLLGIFKKRYREKYRVDEYFIGNNGNYCVRLVKKF